MVGYKGTRLSGFAVVVVLFLVSSNLDLRAGMNIYYRGKMVSLGYDSELFFFKHYK